MNIRRAEAKDLVAMQRCNTTNVPENYPMRFWAWTSLYWPELNFLAEHNGKVVGYVVCWVEPAEDQMDKGCRKFWVGHINSLSILRPYRRSGIGQKLLTRAKEAMERLDKRIEYIELNVRVSNRAAIALYTKLGYQHHRVDNEYYGDGEDAFAMRLPINPRDPSEIPIPVTPKKPRRSWRRGVKNFWEETCRLFAEISSIRGVRTSSVRERKNTLLERRHSR